jgi:hypothetical protein
MKIGAAGSVLFFAWCLPHPVGDAEAGERACNVKDCFMARDVRSFDVIDKSTLIVYVGSQRCAFKVELRGTFCDLTYAPELVFSDPKDLPLSTDDPIDTSLPTQRRGRPSLKVCDNDLGLQVTGGAFTEQTTALDPSTPRDRFGRAKVACQLSSVTSITDDQVVEIYVAHHVAPPLPPMGSGEIQVGNQSVDDTKPGPSDSRPKGKK